MLYLKSIDDYLKILTDKEVKDFVVINVIEYFKFAKKEYILRKAATSLYIFLTTPDKVEKYVQSNSSNNCIHQYYIEILNIFNPEL